LELGGPLSPEALGSLPTLPKVKAGTGVQPLKQLCRLQNAILYTIHNTFSIVTVVRLASLKINLNWYLPFYKILFEYICN